MKTEKIIKTLKSMYPDATCSLDFTTPFELVIAVMLSAQCTDERVNKTTPNIFCKNIIECSKRIVNVYGGQVPNNMEDLITLAGVGRKSANVVMLEAFNNPVGIAVDTHAKRISNRLGLSNEDTPEKIEQDLLNSIPKKYYKDVNHLLVWHGRNCCTARNPKCDSCKIKEFCNYIHKI